MTALFFTTVQQGLQRERFRTQRRENDKMKITEEQNKKIQDLLDRLELIESGTCIKVPELSRKDISIDQNHLSVEFETSMILHSHIITDIRRLKDILEEMKVLRNTLVGILHHSLKLQNQYRLKTAKEFDTYIAQEPSYNTINLKIQKMKSLITQSEEYSADMKQKIGFIRDLTKKRTQEMYKEC